MIHTVLQIPPLAGARVTAPTPTADPKREDAGAHGGGSPCSSAVRLDPWKIVPATGLPSGRATGAGEEGSPLPSSPATYAPVAAPLVSMPAHEAVLAERAPAAWSAVLDERRRQIAQFGHTPQADAALPLKQLPREAARFVSMAVEDCQFQREGWRIAARKHLVRAGAMILAAMDRIEAEPEQEDFAL